MKSHNLFHKVMLPAKKIFARNKSQQYALVYLTRNVNGKFEARKSLYGFLKCMSTRNSCRVGFQDLRGAQYTIFAFFGFNFFQNVTV